MSARTTDAKTAETAAPVHPLLAHRWSPHGFDKKRLDVPPEHPATMDLAEGPSAHPRRQRTKQGEPDEWTRQYH
jgi:hypothetical protein